MHSEAYEWLQTELSLLTPAPQRVLEVGAKQMSMGLQVRHLFASRPSVYLGVDLVEGPGVDVVADGARYDPPFAPDLVVCAEVLEHATDEEAEGICRNALRVLAPGGVLLLTMAAPPRAAHSAVDGGRLRLAEFYRNVTPEVLRGWLPVDGPRTWVSVRWWHDDRHGDLYARAVKPRGALWD